MLRALVGVVVTCGTAAADPVLVENNIPKPPEQDPHAVSLDIAATFGRADLEVIGTGQYIHAFTEGFHFAPQVSFAPNVYFVGAIDIAHFNGTGPMQIDVGEQNPGMAGASPTDPQSYQGNVALAGYTAQITGGLGGHFFEGPVSLGAELAIGERITHVGNSCGNGCEQVIGAELYTTVYPLRVRADFFATPKLAIGALAEIDMNDRHYYDGGIIVSFHALPFDLAR